MTQGPEERIHKHTHTYHYIAVFPLTCLTVYAKGKGEEEGHISRVHSRGEDIRNQRKGKKRRRRKQPAAAKKENSHRSVSPSDFGSHPQKQWQKPARPSKGAGKVVMFFVFK